ncbi:thermonuclease family protein [Pseudoroseicyclus tamaricis]|uniref:TNase-like domain-containing protein n=1 Tax=Pseudoroseicyclus tamaricis TaxID=2705421 RepID=A0A6B2K1N1_9RHOB|nr:thermonuclease family protein [Pseudoroseicyclus tamaricis]NDV01652.1 hypothetical protein [Pseudoroseicyclus tamaricis]
MSPRSSSVIPFTGRRRRRRGYKVTLLARLKVAGLAGLSVLLLYALVPPDGAGAAIRLPQIGQTGTAAGCRITRIVDGDTIALTCAGREERARLVGFDTPELFSPKCESERARAEEAKVALARLLGQGQVSWRTEGRDRYDRLLIDMAVDGTPVSRTMISAGLARAYDGGRRAGWCA